MHYFNHHRCHLFFLVNKGLYIGGNCSVAHFDIRYTTYLPNIQRLIRSKVPPVNLLCSAPKHNICPSLANTV